MTTCWLGVAAVDHARRLDPVAAGHPDVHQHDVRAVLARTASRPRRRSRARPTTMKRPSPSRVVSMSSASCSSSSATRTRRGVVDHEGRACQTRPYDAPVIIDGHNDLVLHRWRGEAPRTSISTRRARRGSPAGSSRSTSRRRRPPDPTAPPYAVPLAEPIPTRRGGARRRRAVRHALRAAGRTRRRRSTTSARASDGDRAPRGRRAARARPLGPRARGTTRGLRSVGLVWSRPNAFAEGVPFRFPASPDTGPG